MDGKKFGAAGEMAVVIRGFVDRKLAPLETKVGVLEVREESHFQTIEALMRRIEALERKLGQKSGAVKLIRADNR